MVKIILIKSPDEWATRNRLVRMNLYFTCLFPPTIYIYIHMYMNLYYIHCSWRGGLFGNHWAFYYELPPPSLRLKIE